MGMDDVVIMLAGSEGKYGGQIFWTLMRSTTSERPILIGVQLSSCCKDKRG